MSFVWALVQVVIGAFVLFSIARIAHAKLVPAAGWGWVLLVGALAVANMLTHRWLGSTINPPFFTAVLFAITLLGMAPDDSVVEGAPSEGSKWPKRAAIALAVGTALGWVSFVEIVRP